MQFQDCGWSGDGYPDPRRRRATTRQVTDAVTARIQANPVARAAP